MRSRSSSYMADGSVDDHVPLNRIVVINPDVHESTDISSGETTPTDGEYDAETFFHPGDRPATSEDVAAKFTELLGDASGWFAKFNAKTIRVYTIYTTHTHAHTHTHS